MLGRLNLVFALGLPGLVQAHGAAPAALGAVGPAHDPTAFIRTNIGIAARNTSDSNTFHYLCPAWWGEADGVVPPMVATADGLLTLAHRARLYRATECGLMEGAALEGAGSTAALAADAEWPNDVWIVTREGADSTLWHTAGGQVVEREVLTDMQATDVAVRGGVVQVAVARPHARILTRGLGSPSEEVLDLPDVSYLGLRSSRWLVATTDEGPRLFERTEGGLELILSAGTSLHGPAPLGDGLLAVADGVLHARAGASGPLVAGADARWTCLQAREDGVYACFERHLHRIGGSPQNPVLEQVFGFSQLIGVDACGAEARGMCTSQWLHFGGEAGLVRPDAGPSHTRPADGGPPAGQPPLSTNSGCAVGRTASPWGWLVLGWLMRRKNLFKSGT